MKRQDEHRPSVINGEEYTFVAFKYYGGADLGAIFAMKAENERLRAHMAATGARFSNHEHGGICHICGTANISYASIFYHAKSNSYIVTGEDCARKLEMSTGDWSAFRAAVHNHLEAVAGKKKALAILEQAGKGRAWEIFVAENRDGFRYEESTITDIVGKLVRYGSISEKALNYIGALLEKIDNRAEIEAQKMVEHEAAANCPTGRIEITGTIVSTRDESTHFGPVTKMLVKHESGFKVWGTMPRSLEAVKGDVVSFTATVEPSQNDLKFGFFSRPTKAVVLQPKLQEVA